MDRCNKHADLYHPLPPWQLVYRQNHFTEIAITVVHNDIIRTIDSGEVSVLLWLDRSAVFNSVDHGVSTFIKSGLESNVVQLNDLGHTCQTGLNRFALHEDN